MLGFCKEHIKTDYEIECFKSKVCISDKHILFCHIIIFWEKKRQMGKENKDKNLGNPGWQSRWGK